MEKTMLVLAFVATFVVGASVAITLQDNMSWAAKPSGVSVYTTFLTITVAPGNTVNNNVSCHTGDVATGGGVATDPINTFQIITTDPLGAGGTPPTGWISVVKNTSSASANTTVWAVCLHGT